MILYAPITGKLMPITDVPDPVFAEKMLGDGFAIESKEQKKEIIYAPLNGIVKTINKNRHAMILETKDGVEVILHVGIDTVTLNGKGFKPLVREGKKISVGDKLLKIDLQYIRKNAPASMVIMVVANRPEITAHVCPRDVKLGEEIMKSVMDSASQHISSAETDVELHCGEWIEIPNAHGLHARPAGMLAQKAKSYQAAIWLEKEGGGRVDAKSTIKIMTLGLDLGHKVRFCSSDVQAITSLSLAVASGLGEEGQPEPMMEVFAATTNNDTAMVDFTKENRLTLPVASPGLTYGQIFVVKHAEREIPPTNLGSPKEKALLKKALNQGIADLTEEIRIVDPASAEILEAHKNFLADPELRDLAVCEIEAGHSAAYAWNKVTKQQADTFAQSGNAYMSERATDMRDINDRILDILLGKRPAPTYPENSIIVTYEVTPSDVSNIHPQIKGVISVVGSPTSHASIMLRNQGIPAFFQVPKSLLQAPNGLDIVLDTEQRLCLINPREAEKESYKKRIAMLEKNKAESLAMAHNPGATKDGYRVEVSGNVSSVREAQEATVRGAEGYGLARSELLFYGRQTAPTEEEQCAVYQGLLDATTHNVTVRLLDAGADKPLAYVKQPKENNPQLGVRGMRIIEDNEEIYRTQIRALLRCKNIDRLRVMTPMISLVSEVKLIAQIFEEEKNKLGIKTLPEIGIMAETPAVCVMAEQFAQCVDFFSVGTNDLTQYTMAMDRENTRLSPLASAANPAVLGMINLLCCGAKKYNKPVAVCGAAASEPLVALLFVGLGVTELASAREMIPEVKAALRHYTLEQLQKTAQQALQASSEEEVRAITKRAFQEIQ